MAIYTKDPADSFSSIMKYAVSGDTILFTTGNHTKWTIHGSEAQAWGHTASDTFIIRGQTSPWVITDSINSMPVLEAPAVQPKVVVDADSILFEPEVALTGSATMPAPTVVVVRNETIALDALTASSEMLDPTVFISGTPGTSGVTVRPGALTASSDMPAVEVVSDFDVVVQVAVLAASADLPAVTAAPVRNITIALAALSAASDLPDLIVTTQGDVTVALLPLNASAEFVLGAALGSAGGQVEVDLVLNITTTESLELNAETTLDFTLELI